MSEPGTGAEQRLYGMMQLLMAHMAQQEPNEVSPWRGVVTEQDALDAILQVAAVIDQCAQSGQIPVAPGIHAGAMLMLIRDYIQPLPPGGGRHGRDPVTYDLEEMVAALREVRQFTGLHG
jgi:hypothetical protein